MGAQCAMALVLAAAFASTAVQAQTAVAPAANGAPETGADPVKSRQRLGETIVVEDSGATIEEVRMGGETQSIRVQPKGGLPRYEVLPPKNDSKGGTRVWKVLGF